MRKSEKCGWGFLLLSIHNRDADNADLVFSPHVRSLAACVSVYERSILGFGYEISLLICIKHVFIWTAAISVPALSPSIIHIWSLVLFRRLKAEQKWIYAAPENTVCYQSSPF